MVRLVTLGLTLALLAAPGVLAQADMVSVSFGPQIGLYNTEDSDDDFRVMVGGALRMRFLPALGIEGSINYRQEDFFNDELTVRSWPVMVTGMIYPLPVIYGAIGAGWYNTTFDWDEDIVDRDDNTEQEFGWHFGGGVEMPLGPQAKLTGDVRYVFLDYDFERVPGSEGTDANFYVITIGLLFGG